MTVVLDHLSPSQFSEHDLCKRKWYIHKILKQHVPGSAATALGTLCHTSAEDFLLDKSTELHPIVKPAEHHLTHWRAAVRNGHGFVESNMRRLMRNGIHLEGRVDLRIRIPGQRRLIVDHKTISNADYAKDAEDLQSNVQMLSYAYDEWCVGAAAGEKIDAIDIAHSSMQTRGAPRHVYTETTVSTLQIMSGWTKIQDKADDILATAQAPSFVDVPGNKRSCHAFNVPCPFLSMCDAHIVRSPNPSENNPMPSALDFCTTFGVNHPSNLPPAVRKKATDYVAGMDDASFPWPPGGAVAVKPTGTGSTGTLLSPDAPKVGAVAEPAPEKPAPTAEATDAERQALLLSLGWTVEDIETMQDDAYVAASNGNIRREDAEIERDASGYIVKITKKGKPPARRIVTTISPSGTETTKATTPEPVKAPTPAAEAPKVEPVPTQRASGKDRRPVRAAEKLAALGYPDAVVATLSNPEMHDIIDGNVRYMLDPVPEKDEDQARADALQAAAEENGEGQAPGTEFPDPADEVDRLSKENDEVREALEEMSLQLKAAREIADDANRLLAAERAASRIPGGAALLTAEQQKELKDLVHTLMVERDNLQEQLAGKTPVNERTGHAGPTLYVGCMPDVRPAQSTHLDIALAPAMKAAADNYTTDKGEKRPLMHYGLIPFNNGPKVVASLVAHHITDFVKEHPVLFVDPASPCAAAVLEVLRPHYSVVSRTS